MFACSLECRSHPVVAGFRANTVSKISELNIIPPSQLRGVDSCPLFFDSAKVRRLINSHALTLLLRACDAFLEMFSYCDSDWNEPPTTRALHRVFGCFAYRFWERSASSQ